MSILAKMLQKQDEQKDVGEIPPGLVQSVAKSANKGNSRSKYLLIAALVVAAVAAGGILVLYLRFNTPIQPLVASRPPQQTPVAEPVPPLPASPVQPVAQVVAEQTKPLKPVVVAAEKKKVTPEKRKVIVKKSVKKKIPVTATASAAKASSASAASAPVHKKPVKADRATIDAYLFAARSAEARRDFVMAFKDYKKANDADPDNYRIINNLASTALNLNMDTEALAYANRALAIKSDYASALINGGIAQVKLGNESGAKVMFARAAALEPLNRQALFNLALLQERVNALDDASATYKKLKDTGDSAGYLGLGRIFEKRGQKSEALRIYRDLLGLPEGIQKSSDIARSRISVLE